MRETAKTSIISRLKPYNDEKIIFIPIAFRVQSDIYFCLSWTFFHFKHLYLNFFAVETQQWNLDLNREYSYILLKSIISWFDDFTVSWFHHFTASLFHDFTILLNEIVKRTVCIHYVNIFVFFFNNVRYREKVYNIFQPECNR